MVLKNSLYIIYTLIFISLLITWFIDLFYIDAIVAKVIYNRDSEFGKWVRDYSQYPPIMFSFIFLVILLKIKSVPISDKNRKILKEVALTWLITLFVGVLFVINVILKQEADRPRPKVTHILSVEGEGFYKVLNDAPEEISGKSFPSGHSSMGFLLAAPFFILILRRRYLLSAACLSLGLCFGSVIGYGRMVLGAHFFTDVYWAGVVVIVSSMLAGLVVICRSEDRFLILSDKKYNKVKIHIKKLKRILTF